MPVDSPWPVFPNTRPREGNGIFGEEGKERGLPVLSLAQLARPAQMGGALAEGLTGPYGWQWPVLDCLDGLTCGTVPEVCAVAGPPLESRLQRLVCLPASYREA
jgi:hypothetical protein